MELLGLVVQVFNSVAALFKSKYAKDLEAAKSEIALDAAKRLKLHDKEFEVFPEIWVRLSDARASIETALLSVRWVQDLNRMSDEEFKKWLEWKNLEEDEKEAMIASPDRVSCFEQIRDYHDFRKADKYFFEFQKYLQKHRIFLNPEIKEKFDEIKNLLRDVLAAKSAAVRHVGQTHHDDFEMKAFDLFYKVKPLMGELEALVSFHRKPNFQGKIDVTH